jgi:hypothetical protein
MGRPTLRASTSLMHSLRSRNTKTKQTLSQQPSEKHHPRQALAKEQDGKFRVALPYRFFDTYKDWNNNHRRKEKAIKLARN